MKLCRIVIACFTATALSTPQRELIYEQATTICCPSFVGYSWCPCITQPPMHLQTLPLSSPQPQTFNYRRRRPRRICSGEHIRFYEGARSASNGVSAGRGTAAVGQVSAPLDFVYRSRGILLLSRFCFLHCGSSCDLITTNKHEFWREETTSCSVRLLFSSMKEFFHRNQCEQAPPDTEGAFPAFFPLSGHAE